LAAVEDLVRLAEAVEEAVGPAAVEVLAAAVQVVRGKL
jgi:hypothetical protein